MNRQKSIYYQKNRWKLILILFALGIVAFTLVHTNRMVKKIANEERRKVELWAQATQLLGTIQGSDESLNFLLDVVSNNTNIPVILTDDKNHIISWLNIDNKKAEEEKYLAKELAAMREQHMPIKIVPDAELVQYIYYKDSDLLRQLRYYPYFQIGIIVLFLIVSYFAFSFSWKYEQDFVWVGMAKETAHQLGTPLSSLMGWVEVMKLGNRPEDEEMIFEITKDINRLEVITERFSKIGSVPELVVSDLKTLLENSFEYLKTRSSKKVIFDLRLPESPIMIPLNVSLFEWVVENLTKNAIDAMVGNGTISVVYSSLENFAILDFSDTGKGIPKADFENIFKPGFTTKKRGWGLGLTLVKRIVENYHKGKIFIRASETDKGTTFRIMLPFNEKLK